jgi:hypothetical protein
VVGGRCSSSQLRGFGWVQVDLAPMAGGRPLETGIRFVILHIRHFFILLYSCYYKLNNSRYKYRYFFTCGSVEAPVFPGEKQRQFNQFITCLQVTLLQCRLCGKYYWRFTFKGLLEAYLFPLWITFCSKFEPNEPFCFLVSYRFVVYRITSSTTPICYNKTTRQKQKLYIGTHWWTSWDMIELLRHW